MLLERLGRFARVIRFDRRDSGLSDPIKDDLTLEAHAADALAVMDAVGASRPVLMGALDGARSLAVLAATNPERAASLIAIAPSTRGLANAPPELLAEVTDALAQLEWPGDQIIEQMAPEWAADPQRRDLLRRYFQTSSTPRQGERLLRLSLTSDVTAALPLVQAPTLVLRTRDSSLVLADAGPRVRRPDPAGDLSRDPRQRPAAVRARPRDVRAT